MTLQQIISTKQGSPGRNSIMKKNVSVDLNSVLDDKTIEAAE